MKSTYILGISAFYHAAAAALLKDGEIIAAAQEERFTRIKHDYNFPVNAIKSCLKQAGINSSELDYVAFDNKPFIKHHDPHAGSAFFPSPFKEAAILTINGFGERISASYGVGLGNSIKIKAEFKFPHSLGFLYSAFTHYIGFKVNSGEYKLMGLAPYGKDKYVDLILKEILDLKDDGSIKLNLKYFNYHTGFVTMNENFYKLFGVPPRKPEVKIEQMYMDLACSVQAVTERAVFKMANHVYKQANKKNLCMAGAIALNCVASGKLLREGPFERIWIQPAASGAGSALGAALIAWHMRFGKERKVDNVTDAQKASLLGPAFSDEQIKDFLHLRKISYKKLKDSEIPQKAAEIIAEEKVLGWFQGRMEFGPRALGNRSILGDPRSETMRQLINLKIKFRESFRPFAPAVLEEHASEYFDINCESPYMLLVVPVRKEKRSNIPAVTHVDYSARVQTVKREDNPLYYDTIDAFYKKTGCPLVINTSFNVRGEPIVCTPEDAYECFMRTNMDYLIMGSFLLGKHDQGSEI